MSLLPILRYPDPRLKKVAGRVEKFVDSIRRLASDMAETMYEAPGIGLAATQVDVHKRVIVIDVSETRDQLLVLINPELVESDGLQVCEEGCLSVPGIYDKVERAEHVVVRYFDVEGREQTIEADGLLAVCLQHVMDHLVGRVFVVHLSQGDFVAQVQRQMKNHGYVLVYLAYYHDADRSITLMAITRTPPCRGAASWCFSDRHPSS